MNKRYFLKIFKQAEEKYGKSAKRLAADDWGEDWKTLITTILSAQSRDEMTIPIAENLYRKYPTLKKLAQARYGDVFQILKKINYNKTKTKHVIEAAKILVKRGKVPDNIDELVKIPGVGRKTANLVITEVHNKHGICVDTHVHRLSNVFGFVKTKTLEQTERELKKVVPKRYWQRINRIFVLWGKDVPGRDKERFLKSLRKE